MYHAADASVILREQKLSLQIHLKTNRASLYLSKFQESPRPFLSARFDGVVLEPRSLDFQDHILTADFGDGNRVSLEIRMDDVWVVFRVLSCSPQIERLSFGGVYCPECGQRYSSVGMALNLHTNSSDLLSIHSFLQAECFREFGMEGAAFAVVFCPSDDLRSVMRRVTADLTEDIPWSLKGGAYAVDHPDIRNSYLLNSSGISKDNVEDWIQTARKFGAGQIDFHGGPTYRFGDYVVNPACFPQGKEGFADSIHRLHEAGLQAGLHIYGPFIDMASEYVTPVPHPDLGGHPYTLAESVDVSSPDIPTLESTAHVSTLTGFFVRNSVHLLIDQEIIKFRQVGEHSFLACERGACGTTPAPHEKGAVVKHLFSIFGLFAPDGDSDLYLEVARRTADFYNELDFDMIYLDAMDGSDIFAGADKAWYYASRFVAELMRHVKRPPIMEMAWMWHHFWYFRTRMGAWDHSNRAHKCLLTEHNRSNLNIREKTLLPQNFGWWNYGRIAPDKPIQVRRIFLDDYEFLASRALKHDWSLSYNLRSEKLTDEMNRFAPAIGSYEKLRLSNASLDWSSIDDGEPLLSDGRLIPITYQKQLIMSNQAADSVTVLPEKTLRRLRIENRPHPGDSLPGPVILSPEDFSDIQLLASTNVTAALAVDNGLRFSAVQNGSMGYARIEKLFPGGLDLSAAPGLRLMVCGDGKGEILNIQVKSPKHILGGTCDRIIPVDFVDWKSFTLIECDSEKTFENVWPFSGGGHYVDQELAPIFDIAKDIPLSQFEWHPSGTDMGIYHVTRENVDFSNLYSISVWINNMKDGEPYSVTLGDISALPIQQGPLTGLSLLIDGMEYPIQGSLPENSYVEYDNGSWYGYDADGNLLKELSFPELPACIKAGSAITAKAEGAYGLELTLGTCPI